MALPIPTNCYACKYSLAGIDRPTCPECGADITPLGLADSEARAERWADRKAWFMAGIGAFFAGVMAFPWNPYGGGLGVVIGWLGSAAFLTVAFTRLLRNLGVWGAPVPSMILGLLSPILLALAWTVVFSFILRML